MSGFRLFCSIMLLLVSSLFIACGSSSDGDMQLRIMTEDYFPYNYQTDGEWKGIAYDVVNEIMKRTGRKDTIEVVNWTDGLNALRNEPNTVLFSTSLTEKRKDEFKWVGALGRLRWLIFSRTGEFEKFGSLEDFAEYRIAVVKDYPPHELLEKENFQHLVVVSSSEEALQKFFDKEVDFIATTHGTIYQYIEDHTDLGYDSVESLFDLKTELLYIAFSQTVPDSVVEEWQDTLDDMKEERVFEDIYRSYIFSGVLPEKLQIYTEPYPPISFLNSQGVITGGGTEVVRTIMNRLNVPDNMIITNWRNAYDIALINPNIILFSLERTEWREGLFNWVGPIGVNSANFYTRTGSGLVLESLEDAASLNSIGTCSSWFTEQMLMNMGFDNLVSFADPTELVENLMSGTIEATVFTDITVNQLVESAGYSMTGLEKQYLLSTTEFYIGISKGSHSDLVSRWGETLGEMKADGSFSAIYNEWYPEAIEPTASTRSGVPHAVSIGPATSTSCLNCHGF